MQDVEDQWQRSYLVWKIFLFEELPFHPIMFYYMNTSQHISSPLSPSFVMYEAARQNRILDLEFLVNRFTPNTLTETFTSIHHAVKYRDFGALSTLLSYRISHDISDVNWGTPIHIAAMNKDIEMGTHLIRNSIIKTFDVNKIREYDGNSALHLAIAKNDLSFAKLLIDNGADLNMKNKIGQTPFHIAAFVGSNSIANLLASKKANVEDVDIYYQTPSDVVKRYWSHDIHVYSSIMSAISKRVHEEREGVMTRAYIKLEDKVRNLQAEIFLMRGNAFLAMRKELKSRQKLGSVIQTFVPNSLEMREYLEQVKEMEDQLPDLAEFVFNDNEPFKLLKSFLDMKDPNVQKLETDLVSNQMKLSLNLDDQENDESELGAAASIINQANIERVEKKIISVIKKVRPLFPNRTNHVMFRDIIAIQKKTGDNFKNLSADDIMNKIIEMILEEGMYYLCKVVHNFQILFSVTQMIIV